MSVTEQTDISYRWLGGYQDPRLPNATWIVEGVVTGDASGGTRTAQLVFNRNGAPKLSRYFSLEAITIRDNDNNSKEGLISTNNLGDVNRSARTIQYRVNLVAGLSSAFMDNAGVLALRRLWLGHQANELSTTGLQIVFVNVNGIQFSVAAEGYTWGSEGASAPGGGILRPTTGLYPN